MLDPAEVPERWGLVEAHGRCIRLRREAVARVEYDLPGEIGLLLSANRRHELGVPFDSLLGRFATLADPAHPRAR